MADVSRGRYVEHSGIIDIVAWLIFGYAGAYAMSGRHFRATKYEDLANTPPFDAGISVRILMYTISLVAAIMAAIGLYRFVFYERFNIPESIRMQSNMNLLSGWVMAFAVGALAMLVWRYYLKRRDGLKHLPRILSRSAEQTPFYEHLYYGTAVKLASQLSAADGLQQASEFARLKAAFGIDELSWPDLGPLFQHQFRNPEPFVDIVKAFNRKHGRGSVAAETLFFGLCDVAMADGAMHPKELKLLAQISRLLGIGLEDTERILFSAGFTGETSELIGRDRFRGRVFGRKQSNDGVPVEAGARARHLRTLGLQANANAAAIKRAWHKLATRYHPEKLVSQNLPPEELEKARCAIREINEAYDWLKRN